MIRVIVCVFCICLLCVIVVLCFCSVGLCFACSLSAPSTEVHAASVPLFPRCCIPNSLPRTSMNNSKNHHSIIFFPLVPLLLHLLPFVPCFFPRTLARAVWKGFPYTVVFRLFWSWSFRFFWICCLFVFLILASCCCSYDSCFFPLFPTFCFLTAALAFFLEYFLCVYALTMHISPLQPLLLPCTPYPTLCPTPNHRFLHQARPHRRSWFSFPRM